MNQSWNLLGTKVVWDRVTPISSATIMLIVIFAIWLIYTVVDQSIRAERKRQNIERWRQYDLVHNAQQQPHKRRQK